MKRNLVIAALLAAGCIDRGPGPQGKKIEAKYIRENLLHAIPAGIDRLDVDLGGKVVYLGNKLEYLDGKPATAPLAPGGTIRVRHYWQVTQAPGPGWRVFALVRGAPGSIDFMNLGPTDMEIGHPVEKWKSGQIIQDVQDIVLRPDWRSPNATLYVGLLEDHGHQIGDRMPASGPHVVDRAIVARTIEVDLTKAPPPPGTLYLPHASGPITIDGIANEPGWTSAATSNQLVTADASPDPVGRATARMAWDEQNLYLFVSITDTDVFSPYHQHDEPLWKADCVEIFIDADGNRRGYVELQVNPNNATFDSFFATTRAEPGDEKWTSNMATAVRVRGTADKAGDRDHGWDVEVAIPLAAVKGRAEAMRVRLPPEVGDRWRLNVVRVDYRSGSKEPGVASWNRISYSDFHALDRMLNVVFADSSGSIVKKPPNPAPPPTPGATTLPTPGATTLPTPGAATAPTPGAATAPTPGATTAPTPGLANAPRPALGSMSTRAPQPGTGSASTKAPQRGLDPASMRAPRPGSGSASVRAPRPGSGSASTNAPRPGAGSGTKLAPAR